MRRAKKIGRLIVGKVGKIRPGVKRSGDVGLSDIDEKSFLDEEEKRRADRTHELKRKREPNALIDHVVTLTEAVVSFLKARTGSWDEGSVGKVLKEMVKKQIK